MVSWKNFDKLDSYGKLQAVKKVNLQEAMAGESGAERVKKYAVPMAAGLTYNFAAKAVDDAILGRSMMPSSALLRSWRKSSSSLRSSKNFTTAPSSTPVRSAWCCTSCAAASSEKTSLPTA